MTYDEIIGYFGSVAEAAESLHLSDKAIYKWKTKAIDPLRQCMIELATRGELKADASAHTFEGIPT